MGTSEGGTQQRRPHRQGHRRHRRANRRRPRANSRGYGTYVASHTTDQGAATLQLPARRLVTVYSAHPDLAPALVPDHDPANDLQVTMPRAPGMGSAIFATGTGELPGLTGRLSPIRDPQERYYLYADNISIDSEAHQPHSYIPRVPLALEDAAGKRLLVTVLATIGRSSLLRYER